MAFRPGKVRFFDKKTTAPGAADDVSLGYRVSDFWIDETNDKYYICVDSTATAAVWLLVSGEAAVNITGGSIRVDSLEGNLNEIIQATSDTLTAVELKGTLISNYGQGAANNLQQLPIATEGMSFLAVCGTAQASNYFRFRAAANDKIYLDGVAGADNGYVGIAAPVVGAMISFFAFQVGAGAFDWYASIVSGSWVAG